MPAIVAATKAAPQKIRGGEHDQAVRIEIRISGLKFVRTGNCFVGRNLRYASVADAGATACFERYAGEEFVRDARRLAPAWAFVSCRRAKPTVVRFATQRAETCINANSGRGRRWSVARARMTNFFHAGNPR